MLIEIKFNYLYISVTSACLLCVEKGGQHLHLHYSGHNKLNTLFRKQEAQYVVPAFFI